MYMKSTKSTSLGYKRLSMHKQSETELNKMDNHVSNSYLTTLQEHINYKVVLFK